MTKTEYMEQLQERLKHFDHELQEEIMEDYRQHFAEGEKQGKSDEALIKELGDIEDMIQELSERNPQSSNSSSENARYSRFTRRNHSEQPSEETYSFEGKFSAVVLDGKSADLVIRRSESSDILVTYKNSAAGRLRYEFYQYEENGVFYAGIKEKKGSRLERKNFHMALDVRIPENVSAITVKVSSGDVQISRLALNILEITGASGDMMLSDIQADTGRFHTSSGDIKMDNLTLTHGKTSASSGDIQINNATIQSGECSSSSGDIKINDSTIPSIGLNSSSGDLEINRLQAEHWKGNSSSGDIKIKDSTLTSGIFSASSGDIDISVKGAPQSVELCTRTGDIRLMLEEADGMEAALKTITGDATLFYKGEKEASAKKGTFTFGNGACKVKAESNSGDISVCCR